MRSSIREKSRAGGCAEFCVNGQSTAGESLPVRKHMTSKKHDVPEELLAKLLADYKKPEDLIGENGLLNQLTKLLVEKALDAELTEHLGHDRHEAVSNPGGNTRKRVLTVCTARPLYRLATTCAKRIRPSSKFRR